MKKIKEVCKGSLAAIVEIISKMETAAFQAVFRLYFAMIITLFPQWQSNYRKKENATLTEDTIREGKVNSSSEKTVLSSCDCRPELLLV